MVSKHLQEPVLSYGLLIFRIIVIIGMNWNC